MPSAPSPIPPTSWREYCLHFFPDCMSEEPAYKLRWRGRELGPFSASEIDRQLDDHEIGMGHEIYFQENWITVEEFLTFLTKLNAAPEPPPAEILPSPPPAP